jgi:hypothetical protein
MPVPHVSDGIMFPIAEEIYATKRDNILRKFLVVPLYKFLILTQKHFNHLKSSGNYTYHQF